MLGDFDYEYGDEGVSTLEEDVYYYDGFWCERCGKELGGNETHDCIECAHCGEHDSCICDELEYDIFEEWEVWNTPNS